MPENGMPGPVCDLSSVREAVCIHTHKIFDSCRDKDCVEDLRFYPTASAQEVLSACQMVRGGTAELLYVYTDVEPVTFNRGFYSIDMRFFYRVTLQVGTGTPRCTEAEGLCVFDKRVILFGSEGSAKIFSSDTVLDDLDIPGCRRSNLPTAVVEAVDPIVLDARAEDRCKPCRWISVPRRPPTGSPLTASTWSSWCPASPSWPTARRRISPGTTLRRARPVDIARCRATRTASSLQRASICSTR